VDLNYDGFGHKVSMVQDEWRSRKVKRTLNNIKKKRGRNCRKDGGILRRQKVLWINLKEIILFISDSPHSCNVSFCQVLLWQSIT